MRIPAVCFGDYDPNSMECQRCECKVPRHPQKGGWEATSIENSIPPNTPPPNTGGEEFVSPLYRAKRTFLVRVPRSVVESNGIRPGELVRLKILQEGT